MVDVDEARTTARQADSRYYLFVQWERGGEMRREGVFNEFDEPEKGSSGQTVRLPTGEQVQTPGLQEGYSGTLTRPWIPGRDDELEDRAEAARGFVRARVVRQDVDHFGDPVGDPKPRTGILRGVSRNGYDADSGTPRTISLSIDFDSVAR